MVRDSPSLIVVQLLFPLPPLSQNLAPGEKQFARARSLQRVP